MKLQNICSLLGAWAPLASAEEWDNVGLLVGTPEMEISGVLVSHDVLEEQVQEAIDKNCNLIVSFHPILFKGLNRFNGKSYVEKSVEFAIKNDIAIYALHTALDKHPKGVNYGMMQALGIQTSKVLLPEQKGLYKLDTYVPLEHVEAVKHALFAAGAGKVGEYSECSFSHEGLGSFLPSENSNPFIGERGVRKELPEVKVGVVFPKHLQKAIVAALRQAHPYEEVAHEIYTTQQAFPDLGLGRVGELEVPMEELAFLNFVKDKFNTQGIRHSALRNKPIQRVAVLGGSGAYAISAAKATGADAFVSADFKYHDFFQAEESILLVDVGHWESERYTVQIIADFLSEKITNFAVLISETQTNPVNYY